jgi:1-acyl-sn-glycerol-3-phosphate acyltransferase
LKILSWNWWAERPKKWFAYFVLLAVCWLGFLYIRGFNWLKVEGKDKFHKARKKYNSDERRNVIIVSNHLTMFDSFVIGIIAYFPEIIFWPSVAPYHLAAEENYHANWFLRLIMYCLRALPVKSSRKDPGVMRKVIRLLPDANVHIFPSGRRSDKPLGSDFKYPIRSGIGFILAKAPEPKPLVIPVFMGGIEKMFGGSPGSKGLNRWFPRFTGIMRRPLIKFGDPIEWLDILEEIGDNKDGWMATAQRVAESINQLNPNRK